MTRGNTWEYREAQPKGRQVQSPRISDNQRQRTKISVDTKTLICSFKRQQQTSNPRVAFYHAKTRRKQMLLVIALQPACQNLIRRSKNLGNFLHVLLATATHSIDNILVEH